MPEGRANTGSTSTTAPSTDPFSRCAIPALTRICAQFAEILGAPADHAASATDAACSIASASPICAATDCAKTACLVRGNDQAERFTSTEVVYGVTGTEVTGLPEYGVSP